MGEVETATARHPTWRLVLGAVAAGLAVVLAVLYTLGTWNPWDLVVLWRHLSNPLRGAVLVFGLALVASWLLAPVRSEAAQAGRMRWRIGFALCLLASLIGLGLFGPLFSTAYREVARAPGGELAVVMYNPGTDDQRLHVWAGRGLGTRHAGELGRPCGATTVTFRGADTVHVSTAYGEFDLRLDPATGAPLSTLGPTCSG